MIVSLSGSRRAERAFDLGRGCEQLAVASARRDDLHADRQAVAAGAAGHRDRGRHRVVDERREDGVATRLDLHAADRLGAEAIVAPSDARRGRADQQVEAAQEFGERQRDLQAGLARPRDVGAAPLESALDLARHVGIEAGRIALPFVAEQAGEAGVLQRHQRVFVGTGRPPGSASATFHAGAPQRVDGALEALPHVVVDRHVEAEPRRVGDPERARRQLRRARQVDRMRIARIGAEHRLEHQADVGDRARDRRDRLQADEGMRKADRIGDRPERRLEADDADVGRRTAARAAAVGAERERREPGRDGRGAAAGRAARGQRGSIG